jgi:hypothetical protein
MEEGTDGWHARLYEPGDVVGIVALYARVFGYERTPEWWRWKFKTFPSPVETTWVAVAETDGSIIGHYPGIPVRLKLGSEIRPAIVNLDVMTAPEFRRRGILLHLGEAANEHWRSCGYAAVVGLPNEQWGSRTQALGWTTIFPLNWLRFPLHIGRVISRPGRLPRPLSGPARLAGEAMARAWIRPRVKRLANEGTSDGLRITNVEAAGKEFDLLWEKLQVHYDNCVVRDAAYVQWRFVTAHPIPYKVLLCSRADKPAGYIAYRTSGPRDTANGFIADLFTAPGDTSSANALLGAALTDTWSAGAGVAMVTAVPGSALYALLRSAGAMPVKAGFHYDLIPLDLDLNIESLASPQQWHAVGSDSDVV